jgi:electron transfer flavoprotein alpha subunit
MSVFILVETGEGKIKKVTLETASYARKVADALNTDVVALAINSVDNSELSKYGVNKVLNVKDESLQKFNAKAYASLLAKASKSVNASVVVLSSTTDSIYLAPMASVQLEGGFASNVVSLPLSYEPFQVKRTAFSNKAFSTTNINAEIKILSIAKNSHGLVENPVEMTEETFSAEVSAELSGIQVEKVERVTGKVTIADAEIVVSGGRGLKGPENWGLIENLASALGAATACSKPVSDLGWRPHSEHVGQTGKPVASNLYIAVGVSGAIQHIAGINSSKVKVVINTDPEAPFFKVADYGVVGDAFEVLPILTQKIKDFKAQNS